MTPKQIALVQESWKQVQIVSEVAAAMFYARLFAIAPPLRSMFRGDMTEHGRKLMTMISLAVGGLHRLETIVSGVQALGRRHAGYGVRDEHYDTVAAALLWTLAQILGEDFTSEVEQAWVTAYTLLADIMKDAARVPA